MQCPLPTCASPSPCPGSAGANGTPSPKHAQLPPLRPQRPRASQTSRLGSVSVPLLSTVACVPDGQAWTQHRPPRRAGVKPDQLVSESCTGRKGGQDRRRGSKGGIFEPHQASCSSFKRVDVQAEAQSFSRSPESGWWGREGRGSWAQGHCQELPSLLGHLTQGAMCFLQGQVSWAGVGRAPPPRRSSSSAFCWEALVVLLKELQMPASS